MASHQLRSNPEIIAIIRSMNGDEPLLSFTAGVILGKNRRAFITGSQEEVEFYNEIIEILDEVSRAMRTLAHRKGIPLDQSSITS